MYKFQDPVFRKIKKEFENRLNKLYTHPLLGDLLDNGEIDYAVLSILEELNRIFKTGDKALNPNFQYSDRAIL